MREQRPQPNHHHHALLLHEDDRDKHAEPSRRPRTAICFGCIHSSIFATLWAYKCLMMVRERRPCSSRSSFLGLEQGHLLAGKQYLVKRSNRLRAVMCDSCCGEHYHCTA
ncbi:hypothetical protein BDW22DRAFT_1048719 [Trametopsis cervina]|nr:hypothetical protein BDW22DRAFT_1048719 [Trametopsis cervina]